MNSKLEILQSDRIGVVGAGYVGLVTGACFSALGFDVSIAENVPEKLKSLKEGVVPFYEPGLAAIIEDSRSAERLHFYSNPAEFLQQRKPEVVFIAVGTPENPDGSANLDYVFQAARDVISNCQGDLVLVIKSTVPPGTALKVKKLIADMKPKFKIGVVNNPEFLKEGSAVNDFMRPDRVVLGGSDAWALERVRALYDSLLHNGHPLFVCDHESAEIAKLGANLMLASRVSVINQISRLSSALGADIRQIESILRSDTRIGNKYLYSGLGYGGSCFPKDVKSFIYESQKLGVDASLAESIDSFNDSQKLFFLPQIKKLFPDAKKTTIALLGVAFKPETDDIREAPALTLTEHLSNAGYKVKAYDPKALKNFSKWLEGRKLNNITLCPSAAEALKDSQAAILVTEWQEFQRLSPEKLKGLYKGQYIFDGKNVLRGPAFAAAGFKYVGVGRSFEI